MLYRLARQALINDDVEDAQEWINRLEQLNADDPRLADLRRMERGQNLDSSQQAGPTARPEQSVSGSSYNLSCSLWWPNTHSS